MEKKITIVHHDIFFDFFFLYLFDVDVKKIFGVCEGKFIKYFCSIELFEHLQNSKFITKLLFFAFCILKSTQLDVKLLFAALTLFPAEVSEKSAVNKLKRALLVNKIIKAYFNIENCSILWYTYY